VPEKRHQVAQRVGGELGTVVAAHKLWERAPDAGDLVQERYGRVGVDRRRDEITERLAAVLVDDVEDLDDPPTCGDIELEVECPHVIRLLGDESIRRRGRDPDPQALAPPLRNAQALLAPEPLDLLAVHVMTLPDQYRVRAAISPPRVSPSEPAQPFA